MAAPAASDAPLEDFDITALFTELVGALREAVQRKPKDAEAVVTALYQIHDELEVRVDGEPPTPGGPYASALRVIAAAEGVAAVASAATFFYETEAFSLG